MSKKVPELRFNGFADDWVDKKLGDVLKFTKGKGLPLNSFETGDGLPAIAYGHLYTDYSEVITDVKLCSTGNGVLSKRNDLLFPGSSTVKNGTAQANALMLDNISLGGDIIVGRNYGDYKTFAPFLSYLINSQRNKLFPITVGSTITHMYGKDLENIGFMLPSLEEQELIGAFFKTLDEQITLEEQKLTSLKDMKKGLLQQMFI